MGAKAIRQLHEAARREAMYRVALKRYGRKDRPSTRRRWWNYGDIALRFVRTPA